MLNHQALILAKNRSLIWHAHLHIYSIFDNLAHLDDWQRKLQQYGRLANHNRGHLHKGALLALLPKTVSHHSLVVIFIINQAKMQLNPTASKSSCICMENSRIDFMTLFVLKTKAQIKIRMIIYNKTWLKFPL